MGGVRGEVVDDWLHGIKVKQDKYFVILLRLHLCLEPFYYYYFLSVYAP